MTEAKYTPGPWELGSVDTIDLDDNPVPARDAGYVSMGDENEADISGPDAPANARLIAAAPEMYETLRACEIVLRNRDQDERESKLLAAVKIAIAKAEGR